MPKTYRKYSGLVFCLLILLVPCPGKAQEHVPVHMELISLIQKLERDFGIKFSYVD